ncbi:MAG: hypothetical protein JNM56_00395 [Planctomycetia bacterium]|nr:hypothetical protein [Planctomycetia bacterium]
MLRKAIFTLALVAGLTGTLVFTPRAEAQNFGIGFNNGNTAIGIRIGNPGYFPAGPYGPPVVYPSRSFYPPVIHDRHYHVYYRTCHTDPWRLYGTYESHHRAHRIEDYLEARGFNARVAHH